MLNLFKRFLIRLQLLPGGIHWQQPTLHIVAATFDSHPLEKLLKAKPNLLQQNAKGQSALHIAIINKLPRNACLLLDSGIDSQLRDNQGQTAARLAVKLYLDEGKDELLFPELFADDCKRKNMSLDDALSSLFETNHRQDSQTEALYKLKFTQAWHADDQDWASFFEVERSIQDLQKNKPLKKGNCGIAGCNGGLDCIQDYSEIWTSEKRRQYNRSRNRDHKDLYLPKSKPALRESTTWEYTIKIGRHEFNAIVTSYDMNTSTVEWKLAQLKNLQHPNLAAVIGHIYQYGTPPGFVMHLMPNGERLDDYIFNQKYSLSLTQIYNIAIEIVKVMIYLESQAIIHGNLLLYMFTYNPKNQALQLYNAGGAYTINEVNELPYAYNPQIHNPPELFDKKPITPALDIYAFGYLLWECLCRLPLEWALGNISISQIKNGVRPVVPESWPKELRLLLAATWSNQPEKRPSANQLLQQFTAMQANKAADYIDTDCFDQIVTRAESNFNDAASLNSFESSDDEYDRPILHGRNDIFRREPRPGRALLTG